MRLNSLFEIIKITRKKYPRLSARISEAEALGRWNLAVGELIAKHSKAIRVKDSVLWVEVDHPIWRAELHYRKQQILDILNNKASLTNRSSSAQSEVLKDIFYLDPRHKHLSRIEGR